MTNHKRRFSSIEILEPRLLFSADVFAGALESNLADDPPNHLLDMASNAREQQLLVRNDDSADSSAQSESAVEHDDRSEPTPIFESLESRYAENDRLEVVFVDTSTPDYQDLLDDLLLNNSSDRQFDIVLINYDTDGLKQISNTLLNYRNLDAIHIISHSADGELELGNLSLNSESLAQNRVSLALWANAFSDTGDILIYGCNLAETEDGQSLINALGQLTKTDVAASVDPTGHKSLGGDWNLEYQTGQLETQSALSADAHHSWQSLLAVPPSPIGHWTFDTDATDSSGNSYGGTLAGDASIDTALANNKIGPGNLSLDGTGDYVNLNAHVSSLEGLTEGTISAWINTSDATESTIFSVSDSGEPLELIKFGIESGQVKWLNFNPASDDVVVYSTATVNDGNWHHVAVTVDGTGNRIYIDGVLSSVTYTTGNAATTSFFDDIIDMDSIDIGRSVRGGIEEVAFTGSLDDVQLHSQALTASEITALANPLSAPVAADDAASTDKNTPVIIDVTANDTVSESGSLTVIEVSNPANGAVVNNGDGTITYTPDAEFVGADSFEYAIIDTSPGLQNYWGLDGNAVDTVGGASGVLTGTTTVPGSVGNGLSFNESTDQVNIPDVSYASEFSVSFDFRLDEINGSLFQYLYSHGNVNATNSLNIFINEDSHGTDPNVMRTVIRDNDDTLDNAALQVDIASLVGDSQWHSYTLTVDANGAEVFIDGVSVATDATRGTDALDPTGDLFIGVRQDLDANRRFGGSLDSLAIYNTALSGEEVADLSSESNVATVNVTVTDNNLPPTNSVPGAQSTNEDSTLTFNTANSNLISISDEANTNLTVTIDANNGQLTLSGTAGLTLESGANGSSSMTVSGTIEDINTALDGLQYVPDTNYNGADSLTITTIDSIIYQLNIDANLQGYYEFNSGSEGSDSSPIGGNTGTLNGGATVVNDAQHGDVLSLDGTGDYIDLSGNTGDFASFTEGTIASWINTTNTIASTIFTLSDSADSDSDASLIVRSDGTLMFQVVEGGGVGTLVFHSSVTVNDGNWHHVAVTVDSGGPHLFIDGVEDTSLTFWAGNSTTQAFFADINTPDSVAIGTRINSFGPTWEFDGLIDDIRIYNQALTASEISELANAPVQPSDSDTIAITVNSVNDLPVATGKTVIATEDVPLVIGPTDFSFTDVESDSLVSVTISGLTLNGGTLTHSAGAVTVTNGMTVTAAELADLTFTSALNDFTNSSFTYTVNDADSGVTSATMNITVNAINDVPVATGNTVIATEDVPLVIGAGDFSFTDVESDSLVSVTISGLTLNGGTLTHSAGAVTVTNGMTVTAAGLADLTFTSALNDSTNSSFTYTVNDAGSGVTSATMNITVNAINDVPVATGNTVTATEDVPLVIGPTDFNYTDAESDALVSVTIISLTLNGGTLTHSAGAVTVTNGMTVTAAELADLTFTSALNDSTNSSFSYTVNDLGIGVSTATMHVIVNAANDAPIITSHGGTTTANINSVENQASVTHITATDTDLGNILNYSIVGGADAALFTIDSSSGALSFFTAPDFENPQDASNDGIYELEISVNDGEGGNDNQSISVSPADINERPTRITLSNSTIDEHTYTETGFTIGSLSTVDEDYNDNHTYSIIGGNDANFFSIGGVESTELVLTSEEPDFNSQPTYEVTIQVIDSVGNSHSEALTITVNELSEAPVITSIAPDTVNEGSVYEYVVSTSGDSTSTITITAESLPEWLSLNDNGDGTATVIGTPQFSDIGEHQVEITVTNGRTESSQIITIIVHEDDVVAQIGSASEVIENTVVDPTIEEIPTETASESETETSETLTQETGADEETNSATAIATEEASLESLNSWDEDLAPLDGYGLVLVAEALSPNPDNGDGTQFEANPPKFIDLVELTLTSFDAVLPDPVSIQSIMSNHKFLDELSEMKKDMDEALKADEKRRGVLTEVTFGLSLSLTAGFVSWILKSGSLIASFLSVIPAWKQFDPLPILSTRKRQIQEEHKHKKDKVERFFRSA